MENANIQKAKSESLESISKKVLALLFAIFVITAYYRFALSIPLLILMFFVKKESKIAKILAGLYAVVLTFVNISVYVASRYNEQGVFDSSVVPIYIFVGLLIASLVYLTRSFKTKKVEVKNMVAS